MSIEIKNINKSFGDFQALKNINLHVETGQLVSLLGPSGCGKTTLLRIIAGLEYADNGQVILDGHDMTTKSVQERNIGFMFQHYALFRHMTVFDNVAFGLTVLPRSQRPSKKEIKKEVNAKKEETKIEKPVTEVKSEPKIDLTILTVSELKELAKKKEIKGYSKMKKDELIDALKQGE